MELGPQNHNGDGLLGANSIIVMYMDPLGLYTDRSRSQPRVPLRRVQTVCKAVEEADLNFCALLTVPTP